MYNEFLHNALKKILNENESFLNNCWYCGNPLLIQNLKKYQEWLKWYKSKELDWEDQIPQCPACGIYDNQNL